MRVQCSSPTREFVIDRQGVVEMVRYIETLPGILHACTNGWNDGRNGKSVTVKVWSEWDEERP
jgi:carotenoid cleavage dioxygenase-like enzyme